MKKNIKTVSIEDLLKQKEKIEQKNKVFKEIYVPSLDGKITILKPSRSLCLEALSMAQDDNLQEKADLFLVYNCVTNPDLKNPELQEAYGCKEPTEIVEKIFESGEIGSIATLCIQMAGYNDGVKVVNDLKN